MIIFEARREQLAALFTDAPPPPVDSIVRINGKGWRVWHMEWDVNRGKPSPEDYVCTVQVKPL